MQPLRIAANRLDGPERCAAELLAGAPAVMRYIRHEMRAHRGSRLSVSQFRALIFASVQDNPSLSAMAEHLGLSLPAASRMADLLVRRGLLERRPATSDRRLVTLSVTRRGKAAYQSARRATRAALARRLECITAEERSLISKAMRVLGNVFGMASVREDRRRKPS